MTENFRQFQPYRHYKGGLYLKMCEARHSETDEIMVVYTCAVSGDVFCRPQHMFYDEVEWEGRLQPRFAPVAYVTDKDERKQRIIYKA